MTEDEIRKLVEAFAEEESPKWSVVWIDDVVSRLMNAKSEEVVDHHLIRAVHGDKLKRLCASCVAALNKQYNFSLDHERLSYIVSGAFIKWLQTFDPNNTKAKRSKHPELNYLLFLSKQAAIDLHNREHPPIKRNESATQDDADGQDQRASFVDVDDAPQIVDPKAQEEIENTVFASSQGEHDGQFDLDDDLQLVTFKVADAARSDAWTGDAEKRVAYVASEQIFRYYLLTKRASIITNRRKLPLLVGKYRHNLTSFIHFHELTQRLNLDLTLLNLGDETSYFKMRHHVVTNSNIRRWMELAVAQLRESKEKRLRSIASATRDLETIKELERVPVLGSVLVKVDGTVSTCFKGQANEPGVPEDDLSHWKKHCEYSLFVDVIGSENLASLQGATLFVTLEPCNLRGPTSNEHGPQPKKPCAVRCVEADLKTIYIGSFDYNKSVRGNGIKILETGIYEFQFENGRYKCESLKDVDGSALLEKYFEEKEYPLLPENDENSHQYRIGTPIDVKFFDADLMFEIYNLNAEFQHEKKSDTYEFDVY